MTRVALYARVSSERQAQQETIESQLAALRQRATADGCTVVPADVYADDGFSGATLARPALERLRDRIAEGGVDRLYIECPDRLSRRYAYQVLLLEEFKTGNVEVVFLQRPSGVSAEDTLLVQVQGMLAEYERARLAERCRRGKLHQARAGKINPLAAAAYGFRYVRRSDVEAAHYDVLLPEAKVVREIFDAFVHQQMSLYAIAQMLNDRQVPTRKGARWVAPTLHAMLKNPAYMGQAAYGKTVVSEVQPRLRPPRPRSTTARGRKTSRGTPPETWITIAVPPIVSAEVFAAAQEQLARNRKLSQRHAQGEVYLLQGLVVCACCGYAFCGTTRKSPERGATYRYYACRNLAASRGYASQACSNPSVRGEELDALVWSSVCQVLQEPERLEQEWQRRMEADGTLSDARSEHEQAQRWAATQERALKRLLDAYEAGALPLEELTPRAQRVREQLHHAQQLVKATEAKVTETTVLHAVVGRLHEFAQQVQDGLDRLDWTVRRQLIRTLVTRVEIDAEKVTVVYRLPPPPGNGPAPQAPPDSTGGSAICRLGQGRQDAKRRDNPLLSLLRLCVPLAPLRQIPDLRPSGQPLDGNDAGV
jgi:site-specific DNA recombinase